MKWTKHKIAGAHGVLSTYWTSDGFEILPVCVATIPKPAFRFEFTEHGKTIGELAESPLMARHAIAGRA